MSIDSILAAHIANAEAKASSSHDHRKYMMYGYWKAIASHLRKIRREFKKEAKV